MERDVFDLLNEAEYVEVRTESSKATIIEMKNGEVTRLSLPKEKGYSVRVFMNGNFGFASSTDFNKMAEIGKIALKLAKLQRSKKVKVSKPDFSGKFESQAKVNLDDVSVEEKLKFVKELDKLCRNYDKRIKSVTTRYIDSISVERVIDNLGNETVQKLQKISLSVIPVAKSNGIMQEGFNSLHRTSGYETIQKLDVNSFCTKACSEAIELLSAKTLKGGRYDLIADPELAGVFIHEAVGHACEADNLLYDTTILKGKLGKAIGYEKLRVVDDPTLFPEFGAYFVDSEGVKAKKTVIIDNGVFKNFLTDVETSSRLSLPLTGNGRAMNYSNEPLVRMSCTYIDRGDWELEEMLKDMRNGVYFLGFKGGQVNPSEGTFLFTARKGYIVRDGEIGEMVRDASIGGFTLETLRSVDAIARDLTFKGGFCGKGGQRVTNTTGSPHIRVRKVVVGGK